MTSLAQPAPPISTPHLTHPTYRPDIDGLRAIAVMSVVLFHAFPSWLPGGFIGVDIFFIISGYLISTIIYGSLERQAFSFTEFYARRIKRIFPALLLVIITCYAFGWFTLFADEFQQLGKHIAGGSVFISNFVLWDESGYFDTTAEIKPLLHLWSLGIEEQFYIVWPLIVWGAWKLRLNALMITVLVLGASFLLNLFTIGSDPSFTFYWPHTRAWELLIGSVLAYVTIHKKVSHFGSATRNLMSVVGVVSLCFGFVLITDVDFPGWKAIIPCVGAVLIICAGPQAWLNREILSSRCFVWLGLISFPLYLWHWPLLSFPRIIESSATAPEVRAIAMIVAIVLAWATYRFVELPLRKRNWKLKTAFLCFLMFGMGATGYFTYTSGGITSRANIVAAKEINDQMVSTTGWKYAKNDTCMSRYPFEDSRNYYGWFCATNRDAPPSVVLLGNSFANHLYPGIVNALPNETVLSIGVCDPTFKVLPQYPVDPCSSDRPARQAEFIDSIINDNTTVKSVIIDGLYAYPNAEYVEQLRARISGMTAKGIKVIFFVPHLMLDYNIRGCFSRPLKKPDRDCTISQEAHEAALKGFMKPMKVLQESMNNVYIFDQNETFCDKTGCSMVMDDLPVFRDEYYHYSEHASKKVGEQFKAWLNRNGLEL